MIKALKTLRNRKTGPAEFRAASWKVCTMLARRTQALLKKQRINDKHIVLVIILRSGVALLEPALRVFPKAAVGVLGLKRDERTFAPHWYYENLPKLSKQSAVVVLDPMLATGGSAEAAVERLIGRGANPKRIFFAGIIAAPQGVARLAQRIPQEHLVLAAVDRGLTAAMLITPGLGDFGDRYFGHKGEARLGGK